MGLPHSLLSYFELSQPTPFSPPFNKHGDTPVMLVLIGKFDKLPDGTPWDLEAGVPFKVLTPEVHKIIEKKLKYFTTITRHQMRTHRIQASPEGWMRLDDIMTCLGAPYFDNFPDREPHKNPNIQFHPVGSFSLLLEIWVPNFRRP